MSSEQGSCYCGNVKVSFTGPPAGHVLCHCLNCRKIGGTAFSNNVVVLSENFKLESGSPKMYTATGESGNKITTSFCGDCGTTLFRTGPSFPGQHIIQAGVIDDADWPNKNLPTGEFYAPRRLEWLPAVKEAVQLARMS